MKYKIRLNPMVISDMQAIKAYIAEDNPEAAAKTANDIFSQIEKLTDFPGIGAPLNTKINIKTDYRFLVSGVYLIFYRVEGEFVSVYRVLNGVRDYLAILFSEEITED